MLEINAQKSNEIFKMICKSLKSFFKEAQCKTFLARFANLRNTVVILNSPGNLTPGKQADTGDLVKKKILQYTSNRP